MNETKETFSIEPSEKTQKALNDFFHLPHDCTIQNLQPREFTKFSYGPLSLVPAAMVPRHIIKSRRQMPLYSRRDEVLQTIDSNRVTIICSDTGSGKTTQIPQYILEDARNKNRKCRILCSEARRIATVSVAERVAKERGEAISYSVGYFIRFDKSYRNNTNLIYVPAGTILQTLDRDFNVLNEVTHVILDEVHERDDLSDFLLLTLKMALEILPHFKLILMSATMNTEKFRCYFKGATVLSISCQGFPIEIKYLPEDEMEGVPEEFRPDLDASMDAYAAKENDFSKIQEYFNEEPNSVDYQHSKTGMTAAMIAASLEDYETVCVLYNLKANFQLFCRNGNTCLDYAKQSGHQPMINIISQANKKVGNLSQEIFTEITLTILKIVKENERGSILVFLPGYDDIMQCTERIKETPLDPNGYKIYYLHGSMNLRMQNNVFDSLNGKRKIILSTNIAESCVTIDDIGFVIDCCKAREIFYDPVTRGSHLNLVWISKQNAMQRSGRTGRTGPGVCYRLCTEKKYNSFADGRRPNILHTPLENMCLSSKVFAPAGMRIEQYLLEALDPPELQSIQIAIENLKTLGALDDNEELTYLGECLKQLTVEPRLGKMLIYGAIFKCLDPILTLVSFLDNKTPYELPSNPDKMSEVLKNRDSLANGVPSHDLILIKLFNMWKKAKDPNEVCESYGLSSYMMKFISNCRAQHMRHLLVLGFLEEGDFNKFSNSWPMVKAVTASGLYPYVGCPLDFRYLRTKQTKFEIGSGLLENENKKGLWILYTSLNSSSKNQFSVDYGTYVTPLNVVLMAMRGETVKNKNENGDVSYFQTHDWITIETINEQVLKFNRKVSQFAKESIKYGPHTNRYGEEILNTLDFILKAEDKRYELVQPDDLWAENGLEWMYDDESKVYMLIKPMRMQYLAEAYSTEKFVLNIQIVRLIEHLVGKGRTVYFVFGVDSNESFQAIGKYIKMERRGYLCVAKIQWLYKKKNVPYNSTKVIRNCLCSERSLTIFEGRDGDLINNKAAQKLIELLHNL